jgi:hypothetical protein
MGKVFTFKLRGETQLSYNVTKIYTDNPYVDEIVYYTKILALGTILKNEQEAFKYETFEIIKESDLYKISYEGHAKFEMFDYFPDEVLEAAGCNVAMIPTYTKDKNKIPEARRDLVTKAMMQYYVEHYEEHNNYYRMLIGLPPVGYEDIYITDWDTPDGVTIDLSKPIHQMSKQDIAILKKYDILEDIIAEDPENRRFINYIGLGISLYKARKAPKFYVLYIPTVDNSTIQDMYEDKLDRLRLYTLRTVYSEAYKLNSDYYDSFIACFIVIQTMIDLITRVQEFVARKEIFDIRTVKYIFESYGVQYFDNIPLKYQIRLVKNLHQLLKVKSTKKCMIDICSLFGFNNITIFKYYLLRDRNIEVKTGDPVYNYKTVLLDNGKTVVVEDCDKNYTLKFFKLPIDKEVDDYIRDTSNYVDYDELTYGDQSWDGGLDHDAIKSEILEKEFNYTRTKYLSIETIYDIAKISTQQSYFFNILYDDVYLEDQVRVVIPYISPSEEIRVSDLFTFLNVLTYTYYGIADDIMDTQGKILYVNGFNFKADLGELATYINRFAYRNTENTEEKARASLDQFDIPQSSLTSLNQLMEMYTNNLDVREQLIEGMYEADNLRIYLIYRKLYESLMETQLTLDYYKNPETGDFYRDASGHATLTEFLKHRCPTLYYIIEEVKYNFDDTESRTQYIATLIDNIVYILEEYIDTEKYSGLFHNLPVVSAEAVKEYIAEVINFFKSFKVTFLGLNTTYIFDDKLEGSLKLIDDLRLELNFTKPDFVEIYETISKMTVHLTKEEKVKLSEYIYMDITTFSNIHVNEEEWVRDERYNVSRFDRKEYIELIEKMASGKVHLDEQALIHLPDSADINTHFNWNEDMGIRDNLYIESTYST